MKKKFFPRPDYLEKYDFTNLLNSLEKVSYKIKELRIQIKKINNKGTLKDFYQSDDNKLDLIYDLHDQREYEEYEDFEDEYDAQKSDDYEYNYKEWYQ